MSDDSQEQSNEVSSQQQGFKQSHKKKRKAVVFFSPSNVAKTNSNITINLALTHYDVIEQIVQELGWNIQRKLKPGNCWDVLWTDHHIQPDLLMRMRLYQKVSHFPGIHVLSRKNLLGLSLMDMYKQAPSHYNFFPKTWLLPSQYSQFRKQFNGEDKTFIIKPEADCQGKGIFLTQNIEQVENGRHYVAQQYISKPLIIDDLKFDFRVYVLMCGISPLRLYIYEQGLARFATQKYLQPNKNNLKKQYIHLTNYAINKKNPKFVYNSSTKRMDVGHKRSLTSVLNIIQRKGFNLTKVKQQINKAIVKTLLLGHPLTSHQYRYCQPHDQQRNMCFHILGIDILLDSQCRPYVLEVNHTPSFVADTPLDHHIKYGLIKDTLLLMNINPESRAKAIQQANKFQQQKKLRRKQKRQLYQNSQKLQRIKNYQQQRDKYEHQNLGKFTKIYPVSDLEQMSIYQQLMHIAQKCYFAENNVLRTQMQKQKASEQASVKDNSISNHHHASLTIDRVTNQISKSPQSPLISNRLQRGNSLSEARTKKTFFDVKQIQKDLLSSKANTVLKNPSPVSANSSYKKQSNVSKLPLIKQRNSIQGVPSPLRQPSCSYVSYQKKKMQTLKIKEQNQKRSINAIKNHQKNFLFKHNSNRRQSNPDEDGDSQDA